MANLTGTTPAILRQQLKVLEKQRKAAVAAINATADKLKKDFEAKLKDPERNGKPAGKRLGSRQGRKPAAAKPDAPAEASAAAPDTQLTAG